MKSVAPYSIRPTPQASPQSHGESFGNTGVPGLSGTIGATTAPDADAEGRRKGILDLFGDDPASESGSMYRRNALGDLFPPDIGDLGPFLPNPFRIPGVTKSSTALASATSPGPGDRTLRLAGLKIADNQSPAPQDRVFYSFNYFNNVNAAINRQQGNRISNVSVFHNMFGFEKTFLSGDASVGIRMPLDQITYHPTNAGYAPNGRSTAVDDLSIFAKLVLLRSDSNRSLLSTGLNVTAPTGPSGFAGSKLFTTPNPATIQPFLGYFLDGGRIFAQGFTSINVPTNRSAATIFFQDISVGYYVFRNADPTAFLTAVIPVMEVHVNVPLNFNGYNLNDPRGTPTVVDLTFGTHIQFGNRSLLTIAYGTPVTSPRPFDGEFVLFYNYNYGKLRRPVTPPTL